MDNSASFWLPERASTFSGTVDWAFNLFYWLSVFFLGLITFLMIYFVIKYARKHPDQKAEAQITHNLVLELSWTLIPLFLVMGLFVIGIRGYLNMTIAPQNAMEIRVIGQKWSWSFQYPQGAITDTLVVPVGQPIRLVMTSRDVLHSFFVPAFRVKADVIPNRYHALWFEATKTGTFQVFCTEYCGTNHSSMLTAVKVVPYDEFDDWLVQAADPGKGKTPVEFGKILYTKRGCAACHTLDGSRLIGTTWKGLWGQKRTFANGQSAVADADYIRRSIEFPQEQVVAGYQPVMPTFKGVLNDREIEAIISFIQSLK